MKKTTLLLASIALFSISFAGGLDHSADRHEVRYVTNNKKQPDMGYQQLLRERPQWTQFLNAAGTWQVIFNEESGKPHKAYGSPIPVSGASAELRAKSFVNTYLSGYQVKWSDLNLSSTPVGGGYEFVNFNQYYQGIKVLDSRLQVKMTPTHQVVGFGLDLFDISNLNTQPSLSAAAAISAASAGITHQVFQTQVSPDLFVLPIPAYRTYSFHLVYEVMVFCKDVEGIPVNYRTLIDAHTGKVMSRTNTVMHVAPANTDVNMSGTVYTTHVYNPSSSAPLVNMRINVNSSNQYTDQNGYLGLTNTSPTSATFYLEGLWCDVNTNNVTPSFTGTLNPGVNNISFNSNANIRELSGYYHVNMIHDYMKSWFPTFPSMDNPLTTNIDVTGSCNAFYNGPSINFYQADATCNCLSQCADVVYHEYGHGISDKFYQWQSASFNNGAMGEGYSDVWGCSVTQSPLLGVGFYVANQDPIRRYDIDPKRYPEDIVGEVHADGEIIAGAWWDVGQLLTINYMNKIFTDTHWGLVTGPNGSEGQVYYDILIEALQADDVPSNGGDNNICNGTPNGTQIMQGFANHGITLITNVNLAHTEVLSAAPSAPITVSVNLTNANYICGTAGALLFWRTDDVSPWNQVIMTGTPPNLSGTIPGQPSGTIVRYYVGATDNTNSVTANVLPTGADATSNANIPYYILVDFIRLVNEDFETYDTNNPTWFPGATGDNATTGVWEFADPPVASYLVFPDPNTIVQPGTQHTSPGSRCFVTENTTSSSAGAGAQDVDGGRTTLESPLYNLSAYMNPVVTYWRWYSNDQGATPGTDYWQTLVSNDGGVNWDTVEYINVADHSYRRYAFKVTDVVTPTSNMVFRFIAEDANAPSLVEAGFDDFEIWDLTASGISEQQNILAFYGYPNPASDVYNVIYTLSAGDQVRLELTDALGRVVQTYEEGTTSQGKHLVKLDLSGLSSGVYFVALKTSGGSKVMRLVVE